MVSVAGWADYIATTAGMESTADLHYAHTPFRGSTHFVRERDCHRRCIVTAIPDFVRQASDFTAPADSRTEAIKFLIHLLADIHNPMHLGFLEDLGGNSILVGMDGTPGTVSLHEVWDTVLIDRLKAGSGWWEVVSANSPLNRADRKQYSSFQLDFDSLENFVNCIVLETSIQVTCPFGYQLNDDPVVWIENRGVVLPVEYLESRTDVALVQLKKSAIRLAQVLELVAQTYYHRESLERRIAAPEEGCIIAVNPFSTLACEEDEESFEDYVFELEDPNEVVHVDDDEELLEAPEISTPPVDFESMEKVSKRTKSKKRADAKKRNKLVLIKRKSQFFVVRKITVVSPDWTPSGSVTIAVNLPRGGYIHVHFDMSIPGALSLNVAEASQILASIVGRGGIDASETKAGEAVDFDPASLVSRMKVAAKGAIKIGQSAFDATRAHVVPNEAVLREFYEQSPSGAPGIDDIPLWERYMMDAFKASADELIVMKINGGLIFVSRLDFLRRDCNALRSSRTTPISIQVNVMVIKSVSRTVEHVVVVDTRVHDKVLTSHILGALWGYGESVIGRRNVALLTHSGHEVIGAIATLHSLILNEPNLTIPPEVVAINDVVRPKLDRVVSRRTFQIVLLRADTSDAV